MTVDLPFARHAVRDLVAHRRKVYCLDWNCSGKKLATGSNDQSVRVWNIDAKHRVPPCSVGPFPATCQNYQGSSMHLVPQEKAEKHDAEFKHPERLVSLLWNPTQADGLATAALEKCLRCGDT